MAVCYSQRSLALNWHQKVLIHLSYVLCVGRSRTQARPFNIKPGKSSLAHATVQTDSASFVLLARYHLKEIVVSETGWDVKGEDAMPLAQALNDTSRIDFFRDYIHEATDAVNIDKVRCHRRTWLLLP